MEFQSWKENLMEELRIGLSAVEEEKLAKLVQDILNANAIYCDGKGRSGLMISAFAMRLSQMKREAYVPWGVTTPAITAADLLLISSASGETEDLVVHAKKAKEVGAKIAAITANTESSIAKLADYSIVIKAGSKHVSAASTKQPMGSLFEQCVLLLLDSVVMKLMEDGAIEEGFMQELHNNLE